MVLEKSHNKLLKTFARIILVVGCALSSVWLLCSCSGNMEEERSERARRLKEQASMLPMYLPVRGEQINAETIFYYLVHVGFLYAEENDITLSAEEERDWLCGMSEDYLQKMAEIAFGVEKMDFSTCMEAGVLYSAGGGIADYYTPQERLFYVSRPQINPQDAPYDLNNLQIHFEGEQAIMLAAFAAVPEVKWVEYRFEPVQEGELEYYRLSSWAYR